MPDRDTPITSAAQALDSLLSTTARLARLDFLTDEDEWSDQAHANLLAYVSDLKASHAFLRDALAARAQPTNDDPPIEDHTWKVKPGFDHVYELLSTQAPSDFDIEANTGTAPWWMPLRDGLDELSRIVHLVMEQREAELSRVRVVRATDQPSEDRCAACAVTMPGRPCVVHMEAGSHPLAPRPLSAVAEAVIAQAQAYTTDPTASDDPRSLVASLLMVIDLADGPDDVVRAADEPGDGHNHDQQLAHLVDEWGARGVVLEILRPLTDGQAIELLNVLAHDIGGHASDDIPIPADEP